MKNFLILFLFISATQLSFAQKGKLQQRAQDKVTEMNALIVSTNETLELTEEQTTKLTMLQVEKFKEIRAINKNDEETGESKKLLKKAVNKSYNKKMMAVLSKKQRMAYRTAKKASKE